MTIDIIAPTDEARVQLRDDFARSAADWSVRASSAALAGEVERARILNRVAQIAAEVSRGGAPCEV